MNAPPGPRAMSFSWFGLVWSMASKHQGQVLENLAVVMVRAQPPSVEVCFHLGHQQDENFQVLLCHQR